MGSVADCKEGGEKVREEEKEGNDGARVRPTGCAAERSDTQKTEEGQTTEAQGTVTNGWPSQLAMKIPLVYAEFMLDEKEFQRKADAAFEDLKKRLLALGDDHGFDVEGEAGKLEVIFEEPEEAKFVISPNTPVREIWISALSTSFKLGWNAARNTFVHEKTGEDLYAVISRVVSQQIGTQVTL
jgi:CyaY protein